MNIVITGASRGIGYELVKKMSADRSNFVFAVSRDAQKLEELKKVCGDNVAVVAADLSDENATQRLFSEIKRRNISVHYVVNNAGALVNKPFMEITRTDLEYVYNVNVFAVVSLLQGLIPLMDKQMLCHVVNISSMGGFQGSAKFAGLSAYSSGKAALACLTECLAEEFRGQNIAFNCLALGAVQTEMLENAFPGYKAPVTASEMASYIADFVTNAHKVMNGKVIPVSLSTP
ncbi:MAG: SDR family NAD(P)-dependent oxidoreductase [Bacteroidia bacterium]